MTAGRDRRTRLAEWRWVAALGLFAVSLALPGLHLVDGEVVPGWRLLLTAWYGFLVLEFPWLANPLFVIGMVLLPLGRIRPAAVFGLAAFAVGLLSLRSKIWIAHHTPIDHLGLGFYVWMAAFAVLASCLVPARSGPPAAAGTAAR